MPTEWTDYRVTDIVAKKPRALAMGPFGSRITKDNFVADGVPVIRGVNISRGRFFPNDFVFLTEEKANELEASVAVPDDLIFTHRGTLGQVGLVPTRPHPRYIVSQSQMKMTCDPEIASPLFMFYYFQSTGKMELLKHVSGSGVPAIASPLDHSLRNLPLRLPPLDVQRKIAGILSAYDDLIENNLRRIQILEEMAQNLYREWFVKFRFPGHEDARFVDSPLGPVPAGWEVVPFSSIAAYVNGYAFKPSDWGTEGKPIVKIKELKAGIAPDTPRNTGDGLPDKYNVSDGDVLFSWSAHLDVYLWRGGSALLNQHLFKVVPAEGFSEAFCFHSLHESMERFRALSLGATMHHIKRSALDQVSSVVPTAQLQKRFDTLVEPMHAQLITLEKQTQTLRRTRDLLLPRLISGELDVSDLDIALPEEISA